MDMQLPDEAVKTPIEGVDRTGQQSRFQSQATPQSFNDPNADIYEDDGFDQLAQGIVDAIPEFRKGLINAPQIGFEPENIAQGLGQWAAETAASFTPAGWYMDGKTVVEGAQTIKEGHQEGWNWPKIGAGGFIALLGMAGMVPGGGDAAKQAGKALNPEDWFQKPFMEGVAKYSDQSVYRPHNDGLTGVLRTPLELFDQRQEALNILNEAGIDPEIFAMGYHVAKKNNGAIELVVDHIPHPTLAELVSSGEIDQAKLDIIFAHLQTKIDILSEKGIANYDMNIENIHVIVDDKGNIQDALIRDLRLQYTPNTKRFDHNNFFLQNKKFLLETLIN
jgi:hypothetical protein